MNKNEKGQRFLDVPPYELYTSSKRYFILAVLSLFNVSLVPFYSTSVWYYIFCWIVACACVFTSIVAFSDYCKSSLLTSFSYLVFSVPKDKDKSQRFFLLDQDHLDIAYKTFGGDKDEIVKENHKLQAQHLMDNKIINGLQKEQHHIAGAYFIFDKNHMFYYDDRLQALLSFTSKKSAQTYINQYIPDFDGSIMYIPIALDGEVKSIVKEQDND
jgi:hypothetical protein